jgi:predicted acylesterase/phospholipase RssA
MWVDHPRSIETETRMSSPDTPIPAERFRILSFDGGLSTAFVIRILHHIERLTPGFLERTDLFSGSSDGAVVSLYLARALSQGRTGLEALTGCIEFHDEVFKTFKLTPRAALRMASGLFSMFDGSALRGVLEKHYNGEQGRVSVLGDLSRAVSIESFNGSTRQTTTYTQLKTPHTSLVEAALASSALTPFFPAFRDSQPKAAYRGDVMFDGALASNSPILPAVSDALHFLWKVNPRGRRAPESFISADDDLRNLSLLSMGSNVQPDELTRTLFSIPWPPLRKDKQLYQYGMLWTVSTCVTWILASMIQRQASDECRFAMQLLGADRFFRFAPENTGYTSVLSFLLSPERFLESVQERVQNFWAEGQAMCLFNWIQNYWMKNPPTPVRVGLASE